MLLNLSTQRGVRKSLRMFLAFHKVGLVWLKPPLPKRDKKSTNISYWSPDGQKFTSKLQVLQFIQGKGKSSATEDVKKSKDLGLPEKRLKKMTPKYKAIQTLNVLRKNNELMKSLNKTIDESGHCGSCKNCLDMPKFGGPGKMRQACLYRPPSSVWDSKKIKNKNKKLTKVKMVHRPVVDDPGHKIVCKSGNYKCPLCSTSFMLNQPYGRHVMAKECQISQKVQTTQTQQEKDAANKILLAQAPWMLNDEDGDEAPKTQEEILKEKKRIEEIEKKFPKIFVYVNPATHKRDSWVASSLVPPLKLLARSKCPETSKAQVPISVKEGLEFYHAFVFPNNCPEDIFFKYVRSNSKLSVCKSVKIYEKLCKEPLKIAMYFERKIRTYRDLKGSNNVKTRRWVSKYNIYLQLPFHDIFLALSETKYRVIEYCKDDEVKILCLSCPSTECSGCLPAVAAVKSAVKTTKTGKLVKIPLKYKSSKKQEVVKPSIHKKDSSPTVLSNTAPIIPPLRQTVVKKIKPEKMDFALAKRSLMDDRMIRLTPANAKRKNVVEQLEVSDTSPKSKRRSAMAATVALKLTSIQSGDGADGEDGEGEWSPAKGEAWMLKSDKSQLSTKMDDQVEVLETSPKRPSLLGQKNPAQSPGGGKLVFTNKVQLLNLLKQSPKSGKDQVSIDLTSPSASRKSEPGLLRKKSVINANPLKNYSVSKTANGPAGLIKCVGCLKHFTTRVELFNHRAQCGKYKLKAEAFKMEALKRKSVASATITSSSQQSKPLSTEEKLFQEQLKDALHQSAEQAKINTNKDEEVFKTKPSAAVSKSESPFDRLFNSGPLPSKQAAGPSGIVQIKAGTSMIQQSPSGSSHQKKEKCIIID